MLKHFVPIFAWCATFALTMFVCAALIQSIELFIVGLIAVILVSLYGTIGIGVDSLKGKF